MCSDAHPGRSLSQRPIPATGPTRTNTTRSNPERLTQSPPPQPEYIPEEGPDRHSGAFHTERPHCARAKLRPTKGPHGGGRLTTQYNRNEKLYRTRLIPYRLRASDDAYRTTDVVFTALPPKNETGISYNAVAYQKQHIDRAQSQPSLTFCFNPRGLLSPTDQIAKTQPAKPNVENLPPTFQAKKAALNMLYFSGKLNFLRAMSNSTHHSLIRSFISQSKSNLLRTSCADT